MKILNPLNNKEELIQSVLRALAAQENCDGEPYDQMQMAANYIDELESKQIIRKSKWTEIEHKFDFEEYYLSGKFIDSRWATCYVWIKQSGDLYEFALHRTHKMMAKYGKIKPVRVNKETIPSKTFEEEEHFLNFVNSLFPSHEISVEDYFTKSRLKGTVI